MENGIVTRPPMDRILPSNSIRPGASNKPLLSPDKRFRLRRIRFTDRGIGNLLFERPEVRAIDAESEQSYV